MARIQITIIAATLVISGCMDTAPREPTLELAQQLFRDSDWDGAVEVCSHLVAENPQHAEAFLLRGRANLMRDHLNQAIDDFTAAIQINDQDPEPFYQRAIAYQELGKQEHYEQDQAAARDRDLEWKKLDAMRFATLSEKTNYRVDEAEADPPADADRQNPNPEDGFDDPELVVDDELLSPDFGNPLAQDPGTTAETTEPPLTLPGGAELPSERVSQEVARRIRLPADDQLLEFTDSATAVDGSPLLNIRLPQELGDSHLSMLLNDTDEQIPSLARNTQTDKTDEDKQQEEQERIELERQSQEETEAEQLPIWRLPSGNQFDPLGGAVVPQTGSALGQMPIRSSEFNGLPAVSFPGSPSSMDSYSQIPSGLGTPILSNEAGYSTIQNAPRSFALQFSPRSDRWSPSPRPAYPGARLDGRNPALPGRSPGGLGMPSGSLRAHPRRPSGRAPASAPAAPEPAYTWDYQVPYPGLEIPTTGIVHDARELNQ